MGAAPRGAACVGKLAPLGVGEFGRTVRVPLELDRRIFTPIARSTPTWETAYDRRSAVERVNSRIDRVLGFEQDFIRGLAKMKPRVTVLLVVMLAMALGRIRADQAELMRSLTAPVRHAAEAASDPHHPADLRPDTERPDVGPRCRTQMPDAGPRVAGCGTAGCRPRMPDPDTGRRSDAPRMRSVAHQRGSRGIPAHAGDAASTRMRSVAHQKGSQRGWLGVWLRSVRAIEETVEEGKTPRMQAAVRSLPPGATSDKRSGAHTQCEYLESDSSRDRRPRRICGLTLPAAG